MDIHSIRNSIQISSLRTGQFASPEEKASKPAGQSQDRIEISQDGRQALADLEARSDLDQISQTLETVLSGMTRDEFAAMVKDKLSEYKMEDKINWETSVDPQGDIWRKTYMDSLLSQWKASEAVIKDYYTDALQEVLHNPFGSSETNMLNFISAKYAQPDSKYYVKDMSPYERDLTIRQLWSLVLRDKVFTYKDPYALKGKLIDAAEVDKIAKQAADDKISELVRQYKESKGITE